MIPINLNALSSKMTGKSNVFEVQGNETYMKNNQVVFCLDHVNDLSPGIYNIGTRSKVLGEYVISSYFKLRSQCTKTLVLPMVTLSQIYATVKAWKSKQPKDLKEIKLSITPAKGEDSCVFLTVFGDGFNDLATNLNMSVKLGSVDAHDTNYVFDIEQFLTWLYPVSVIKEKQVMVQLVYSESESYINDQPLFLEFKAYEHAFQIGHQVCPKENAAVPGEEDPEKYHGISWVDDEGVEKQEFVQEEKPKSKSKSKKKK